MRIVLDANVIISALVAEGVCHDLVRDRLRLHTIVTSALLDEELHEKLRVKFKSDPQELPLLAALRERAEIVTPEPLSEPVCRDPDDDWVLATAVAGRAGCIVTGDEDLLVLKKFRRIRILSPRKFLELLDRLQ